MMIDRPKKRAAAYLRRSSDGSSQERSLHTQRGELVGFAERNGYQIADHHWYSDDAMSGGRDDRPGFQALMAAVDRREVDAVLCYESGRLSRQDPQDLAPYWARLNSADVELRTVCEGVIETKTFEGFLMAIVRQKGKSDYLQQVADSVCRGLRAARKAGKWTSHTPLGYSKVDGRLVLDPDGMVIVRRVFEWRAGGNGYKWIARELFRAGIKPSRADHWSANSVRHIIHNQVYLTGEKDLGRHSRGKYNRLVEEPEVVKVAEPFIEQELWDRAHAHDGRKGKSLWKGDSNGFALSGLCRCGTCGSPLYAFSQYGERRLRCGRSINRGDCPSGATILHDKLLAAVVQKVQEHLLRVPEDKLRRMATALLAEDRQDGTRERLQAQLEKLQRKIARALDAMLEAGTRLHGDIQRKLDAMAAERDELQQQIKQLPAEQVPIDIDKVLAYLKQLQDPVVQARADLARQALGCLVDHVTVTFQVIGGSERRKYYRVREIEIRLADVTLLAQAILQLHSTIVLDGKAWRQAA